MSVPLILSDMIKKSFLLLMLIFFTCGMLLAQNTEIKPVKFLHIITLFFFNDTLNWIPVSQLKNSGICITVLPSSRNISLTALPS
jgi:hypothetical protein